MIVRRTIAVVMAAALTAAAAASPSIQPPQPPTAGQPLDDAQRLFYNAQYEAAAALVLALRAADPEDLASYELRSSALHFQIRRQLGDAADKDKALKQCEACPALMTAFLADVAEGRAQALARLNRNPGDESAMFFLGKLDLNYVWLQLGTLGRKTGWDQYWEARKSLDAVLRRDPQHVRARVARAWIDYIVDTKMPWGTGWILGGGNKKKALATAREAASARADFFVEAEAAFALWDLYVRERRVKEAIPVARDLARRFPDNKEIARFLEINDR